MTLVSLSIGAVDCQTGEVTGVRPGRLTNRERALFTYLAERPNQQVPASQLLVEVWNYAPGTQSRTVYSTVQRLRKKMERDPQNPTHIVTIGKAYAFRPKRRDVDACARSDGSVPMPMDGYVERPSEWARLLHWASSHPEGPSFVTGPPGVGKTRLVVEFAMRAERPVCYVSADGVGVADEVWGRIARQLRLPTHSGLRLPERVARVLSSTSTLLIVDALDRLPDEEVQRLQAWSAPGWLAVRRREPSSETWMSLKGLTDGRALLARRIQERWPRWSASPAENHAMTAIVERVDGHPLALELLARSLPVMGAEELLKRLASGDVDLGGGEVLSWAVQQVSSKERDHLRTLSAAPDRFDLSAAIAMCGQDGLIESMSRLLDMRLLHTVEASAGRQFVVPDGVRVLMEPSDSDFERHATHYAGLGAAEVVEQLVVRGGASEMHALTTQHLHLRQAAARGVGDHAGCAARAGALALMFFGDVAGARALIDDGLRQATSAELVIWLRRRGAECDRLLGHVDVARRDLHALLDYTQAHRPVLLGRVQHTIGVLEEVHGTLADAEAWFTAASLSHAAVGDTFRAGLTFGERATLYVRRGQAEESIGWFKDALAALRAVNADYSEALYLGNLAVAYLELEHNSMAQSTLEEALERCRRLGPSRFEVGNLTNLGILLEQMGDLEEAMAMHRRALALIRTRGDQVEEGAVLTQLGHLSSLRGELGAARRYLDRASAELEPLSVPYHRIPLALFQAELCRLELDAERCRARVAEGRALMKEHDDHLLEERFQREEDALDRALREIGSDGEENPDPVGSSPA